MYDGIWLYQNPYMMVLVSDREECPFLFNIFINAISMNLKLSGHGCYSNNTFLGCSMYADDLIIIYASQSGLQAMLDVCIYMQESFSKIYCQKIMLYTFWSRMLPKM